MSEDIGCEGGTGTGLCESQLDKSPGRVGSDENAAEESPGRVEG